MALVALLPALALTSYIGSEHRRMAMDNARASARFWASEASYDQDQAIQGARLLSTVLAQLPGVRDGPTGCSALLVGLLKQFPMYTAFGTVTPDGDLQCSSDTSATSMNLSDRAWFQRAIQTGDFAVGDYQLGRISGKTNLGLGYPLLGQGGAVEGVLFTGLDLAWQGARLGQDSDFPSRTNLMVLDHYGTVLVNYPSEDGGGVGESKGNASVVKAVLAQQGEGTTEVTGPDGVTRLYAFTSLSGQRDNGVYVAVGIPADEAYSEANLILVASIAGLGLLTLLTLAAAWVGGGIFIVSPVNALLGATKRIASGDLGARAGLSRGPAEVGKLARAFDDMAETLEKQHADADRAEHEQSRMEQRYRTTLDGMLEGCQIIGFDWQYLYLNDAAASHVQRAKKELLGHNMMEMFAGIENTELFVVLGECLHKRICHRIENEFAFPDGIKRWFELAINPVPEGIFLLSLDVTERKLAEEALVQSEKRFRSLIEHSSDSILLVTASGRITFASSSTTRISGYPVEDFLNRDLFYWIHPDDRGKARAQFSQLLQEPGRFISVEFRARGKEGGRAWIEATVRNLLHEPDVGAIIVNWRDTSKRKLLHEQIDRQFQRLTALRNIDLAITGSLDLRITLNVLLDQVTAQLHVDAASVLLLNTNIQILEYAAGRGFRTGDVARSSVRMGEGVAGKAAQERRVIIVPDLSQSGIPVAQASLLTDEEFVTYHAVPLLAKGHIQGVLQVFHRSRLDPDVDWIGFLEALAGQAAIAVDNAMLFNELQRAVADLAAAYDATLEGWIRALDFRHKETEGHSRRVTDMAVRLARALGFAEADLVHLRRGALLHDIGKMGVPDGTLLKPASLSEEEWVTMRRHPEYAYQMLSPIAFLRPALDIPYCHHEKWDGTGYPRGLKGEEIPLAARLFAVVDVWESLRSNRVYRAAWPEDRVREHIRSLSGTSFDPQVVDAFLSLLESGKDSASFPFMQ